MARYKNYVGYGGAYKKGQARLIEVALIVLYVISGLGVFGLASINLAWITDWAPLLTVISVVGVFAADKERQKKVTVTAVEVIALILAIALPLTAAGYIPIDISTYLADSVKAFALFLVSVGSLIVVAKQD